VKLLVALMLVLAALLGGLVMIFEAPPHLPPEVPGVLGLAYAAAVALILRGPIGRALVGQLGGEQASPEVQARLSAQMEDLLEEVRLLRQENGELQERLDFTERMLARTSAPGTTAAPDREA
jgi:hypothetical protein